MIRTDTYMSRLVAFVVDEVHCDKYATRQQCLTNKCMSLCYCSLSKVSYLEGNLENLEK